MVAAIATGLVVRGDPSISWEILSLAVVLALLGLGGELLSINRLKESAGSVALIPFAAAAIVAPHSVVIGLIFAVQLVAQLVHRRPWLKAVFNIAQITLGFAVGIMAYRALGGFTFVLLVGTGFVEPIRQLIVPTAALIASVMLINSVSVSAVIAVTSHKRFLEVWAGHAKTTPFALLLLLGLSFYLTWLSANLGLLGTAAMAIPLVAVRQLYRTTIELTTVTEELLDLMVAAIEARDPYTSGHSQRVARASEVIARAIGLSAADVERVSVAALLHDVGKIDEQFAPILAKEGRLTPEEWEVMKRHPIRGAELVGLLSSLRDIVKPVRHHHENWDGTGYPDGLRGEEIPLASRIIMFADTLDAITTDRPYRKALTMAEARSEFIKFRGRQFDPTICDRVLAPDVWAELYTATARDDAKPELRVMRSGARV